MSKLPEDMEERTIEMMLPGDRGYTTPWAMWADINRDLWINGHYTIEDEARGTVRMLIERTRTGVRVFRQTIAGETYQPGISSWDSLPHKLPVDLV